MDLLDQKLLDCFPGKVVRKDLVAPLRNEYHVPSYVVEFLLGRFCSSQDEDVIRAGLAEVQKTLTEHFVRSEKAPEIQAILRDRGRYTIIDKVKRGSTRRGTSTGPILSSSGCPTRRSPKSTSRRSTAGC